MYMCLCISRAQRKLAECRIITTINYISFYIRKGRQKERHRLRTAPLPTRPARSGKLSGRVSRDT